MYLWKYWRESRIVSTIAVLCLAAAVLLTFKGRLEPPTDPAELSKVAAVFLYVQLAPVALLAWLMGGFGVGRDLGDGSGSFLLTRPRLRRWFSWRDWGFGLAHIAVAVVVLNLLFGYVLHRLAGASGLSWSGALSFRDMQTPVKITYLMSLNCMTLLLFGGLVFGVTYCSTIAVKHARGVMLGAAILIGYLILVGLLHHYLPAVDLPSLLLQEFRFSRASGGPVAITDPLRLEIMARAAVMLALPVAAQLILERSDI
jgi:hypothetical protein